MQINITVLSCVKASAVSKALKPYQLFEIAYKNNSFQGKIESVKINQYSAVYGAVSGFKAGELYDVTKEKEGDFWQWTKVVALPPGSVAPTEQTSAASSMHTTSAGSINKSVQVKSTYETPEERAIKQRYIIKQSSLSGAINLLTVGAKSPPTVEAVLALADTLVAYVMETPEQTVQGDLFKMENDVEVM
jgi:hypothetical protein